MIAVDLDAGYQVQAEIADLIDHMLSMLTHNYSVSIQGE